MNAPSPIEIDPRPCELCGRTIDRHRMVDGGDGPEFFCYPDDDIVRQWELADPRDAWRHTGEAPPPKHIRNSDIGARPTPASRPYRTPQSTIDAFFYVADHEPDKLTAWLAKHPADEAHLFKLWKAKRC